MSCYPQKGRWQVEVVPETVGAPVVVIRFGKLDSAGGDVHPSSPMDAFEKEGKRLGL